MDSQGSSRKSSTSSNFSIKDLDTCGLEEEQVSKNWPLLNFRFVDQNLIFCPKKGENVEEDVRPVRHGQVRRHLGRDRQHHPQDDGHARLFQGPGSEFFKYPPIKGENPFLLWRPSFVRLTRTSRVAWTFPSSSSSPRSSWSRRTRSRCGGSSRRPLESTTNTVIFENADL